MADDEVRITLRLPVALRDKLANAAAETSRSMNGEIIARLEAALDPPKPDPVRGILFDELAEIWANSPPEARPKVSANLGRALEAWLEFREALGSESRERP